MKTCHPNTPYKLKIIYRKFKGKYHPLSIFLKINVRYVYDLVVNGKEPTDKTSKGQEARIKLFLPAKKKIIREKKEIVKKAKPDFIVQWDHLPKEERHKVIQEYLSWRNKNKS